jgi:hypothetical protein
MPKSTAPYDVHPGVVMVQKWIAALPEKTGRTLDEWIAVVKKDEPKDSSARRSWLKSKHNLGSNSAWWIADRAAGKGGDEDSPGNISRPPSNTSMRPIPLRKPISARFSKNWSSWEGYSVRT